MYESHVSIRRVCVQLIRMFLKYSPRLMYHCATGYYSQAVFKIVHSLPHTPAVAHDFSSVARFSERYRTVPLSAWRRMKVFFAVVPQ